MGATGNNIKKLLERIRRKKYEPRAIWVVAGAGRFANEQAHTHFKKHDYSKKFQLLNRFYSKQVSLDMQSFL